MNIEDKLHFSLDDLIKTEKTSKNKDGSRKAQSNATNKSQQRFRRGARRRGDRNLLNMAIKSGAKRGTPVSSFAQKPITGSFPKQKMRQQRMVPKVITKTAPMLALYPVNGNPRYISGPSRSIKRNFVQRPKQSISTTLVAIPNMLPRSQGRRQQNAFTSLGRRLAVIPVQRDAFPRRDRRKRPVHLGVTPRLNDIKITASLDAVPEPLLAQRNVIHSKPEPCRNLGNRFL